MTLIIFELKTGILDPIFFTSRSFQRSRAPVLFASVRKKTVSLSLIAKVCACYKYCILAIMRQEELPFETQKHIFKDIEKFSWVSLIFLSTSIWQANQNSWEIKHVAYFLYFISCLESIGSSKCMCLTPTIPPNFCEYAQEF